MTVVELARSLARHRLIRYGAIGVVSTLIHAAVAWGVIYWMTPSVLLSNTMGFLVAYLFSYTMQSLHVFGHALSFQKAIRYFFIQFGALLASVAISHLFPYNSYIKTFLVILFMPLVTYLIHRFWTFKE